MNRRTFVAVPLRRRHVACCASAEPSRRWTHRLYIQRTSAWRVSRQVDLRIALVHG